MIRILLALSVITAFAGCSKGDASVPPPMDTIQQPLAHFSWSFKDGRSHAPAGIILVNESVNATSFKWHIDGSVDTSRVPGNIVFNHPGKYVLSLIAINAPGRSDDYRDTITVNNIADNPVAGFVFAYHPFPYQAGESIQLVNQSRNSDAWKWTFGEDSPAASAEQHPVIVFERPGEYPVTLIARKGEQQSAPKTIRIKIG